MSDKATCPFCGEHIHARAHPSSSKIITMECPLVGCTFSWKQWQMRPPKNEQPAKAETSASDALLYHMAGQIGWLQSLVERLTIEQPDQHYTVGLDYSKKESDYPKLEKEDK